MADVEADLGLKAKRDKQQIPRSARDDTVGKAEGVSAAASAGWGSGRGFFASLRMTMREGNAETRRAQRDSSRVLRER